MVVIDRLAWNFILIRELSFWPAKWSDVSGANKQRTADHHVYLSISWLDLPKFSRQLDGRFDGRLVANWRWKNGYWDDLRSSPKLIGDQFDRLSNVHGKTGPYPVQKVFRPF